MKIFPRLLPSAFDPLKLAVLGICAWAALLGSCSQTPITVRLHAMQSSGRVSFVCRGDDDSPSGETPGSSVGHKLDECPDYEHATRRLLALVTQTATQEVAVVDLYTQSIVDIDQTAPGYSFLRVGAQPGAIVTTPGGAATFVGVSGLQKNGIFALPTTCILPPKEGEAARDLTSWAACHLSSAPGDISVIVDPVLDGDAPRTTCDGITLRPTTPRVDDACPADLTREPGPVGRRKLLVALPDEHKLVLLDAQHLLDQQPGSFGECEPEATFALDADAPTTPVSPVLPDDLQIDADTDTSVCLTPSYPALDASVRPTPGGIAVTGDRAYVADRTKPVVHVLDLSDPCTDRELPPLLPYSYSAPNRVVTTSRVAVSPVSPSGRQFVYAIDQDDQPTSSVMAFDLTRIVEHANQPNRNDYRTPLVFEGAPRQPYMPPDRLRFSAPVRDISFVMRDFPKPDPGTGAGEFGVSCDPDPTSSGPGTAYRSNSDFTEGARPVNLRGLFGFAMLTNGQVAVIDVEDFDKDCRRPATTNTSDLEDLHGCKQDKTATPYTLNGVPTVTDESSCNVVEPHRPRSASLSISSSTNGVRAPSLRAFPQFSNPNPADVITVNQQPQMLATDFANPVNQQELLPAEVNVSTQSYVHCTEEQLQASLPPCDGGAQPLFIEPSLESAPNSLTLPLIEPRSYAQDETLSLVFEGRVFNQRTSAFLAHVMGASEAALRDPDANFCGAGVEDGDTIRARGEALGVPSGNLSAWAGAHADYVQISGDFPKSDDPYWTQGNGKECAALLNSNKSGRDACTNTFGNIDNPAALREERDLSILRAYGGQLDVKPRQCPAEGCARRLDQLACCFPAGTAYTVRASNQWLLTGTAGLHDIAVGANGRCEHTASCDRRKQYFNQRAFEVCDPTLPAETHTVIDEVTGEETQVVDFECASSDAKVGCVGVARDNAQGGQDHWVLPGDQASGCIFENLTSRFVVYRGGQPSTRGMTFNWQTTGGFVPQSMSLLQQSPSVSPQSLGYLPERGFLAVVDASTLGLVLFDLNSLGVVLPSPYY